MRILREKAVKSPQHRGFPVAIRVVRVVLTTSVRFLQVSFMVLHSFARCDLTRLAATVTAFFCPLYVCRIKRKEENILVAQWRSKGGRQVGARAPGASLWSASAVSTLFAVI